MAKKVSKHSRAARRLEIEEPEAKSLGDLPRAEKTDLTSAIIRATVKKNEDLLTNKMEKKQNKNKVTKEIKMNKALTNLNKERLEKAINLTDRLQDKISKSKQRSKMVQTVRKSNWDSVNAAAKGSESSTTASNQEDKDVEEMEDDDFYSDKEEPITSSGQTNAFALLDEVEA